MTLFQLRRNCVCSLYPPLLCWLLEATTSFATQLLVLQTTPCILTQQLEDHRKPEWFCELQGSDVEPAQATFVSLEGLDDQELEDSKVISDETTFQASGTEILLNGILRIPPNSKRQFGKAPPRGPGNNNGNGGGDRNSDNGNKRGTQSVEKKVFAVRINALNESTTRGADEIIDFSQNSQRSEEATAHNKN
jgi:hypothetical protein